MRCPFILPLNIRMPAISKWTHRKVNPVDDASFLQQQLVKILVVDVRDVEQQGGIANGLFRSDAADIYGAPCKMIAQRGSTYSPRTAEGTGHFAVYQGASPICHLPRSEAPVSNHLSLSNLACRSNAFQVAKVATICKPSLYI